MYVCAWVCVLLVCVCYFYFLGFPAGHISKHIFKIGTTHVSNAKRIEREGSEEKGKVLHICFVFCLGVFSVLSSILVFLVCEQGREE